MLRLRAFSRDTGRTSEDGGEGGVFQMDDVRYRGGAKKSVFARTFLMDDPLLECTIVN